MSDGWIKTAKVGDKVVCIDTDFFSIEYKLFWVPGDPVVGEICEIEEIYDEYGLVWMSLVGKNFDFGPEHFRPLDLRKTSITIFTDMLKPTDQPVKVEA